jgi:hypothetical protein
MKSWLLGNVLRRLGVPLFLGLLTSGLDLCLKLRQ